MTVTALRPLPTTTTDATTAAFTIARLLDDHPALPLSHYSLYVHQDAHSDRARVSATVSAVDPSTSDRCRIAAVLAWADELDMDVVSTLSGDVLVLEAVGAFDGMYLSARTTTTTAAYQAAVRDLRGQVAS